MPGQQTPVQAWLIDAVTRLKLPDHLAADHLLADVDEGGDRLVAGSKCTVADGDYVLAEEGAGEDDCAGACCVNYFGGGGWIGSGGGWIEVWGGAGARVDQIQAAMAGVPAA